MTKSRGIRKPHKPWSDFEIEVMRKHYPDTLSSDLAELLCRPVTAIYAKAEVLGLHKSTQFLAGPMAQRLDGHRGHGQRFQKGNVPWSAGTKGAAGTQEGCRRTQFKKGGMSPRNLAMYVPIGGHRINSEGYLDRKMRDDGPPQNRFEREHRLVWIEAHGPIPAGHVVVFKGGKKTAILEEITPDRLECISRAEVAARNRLPPELQQIHQLRGQITRQINKRAKEQPHEQEH